MQRMGQVISLKPGAVAEYNRLHAAVWPEVLRVIHNAHIRNYSIFLKEPENLLFAYWEYHGTVSIDQQRYNFQFGGDAFWEIKGGKKRGMISRVATSRARRISGRPATAPPDPPTGASSAPPAMPKASRRRSIPSATAARPRASARSTSYHWTKSRINYMLTRDEAQKLAKKVIGLSTFPECQVTITAQRTGLHAIRQQRDHHRVASTCATTVSIAVTRDARSRRPTPSTNSTTPRCAPP